MAQPKVVLVTGASSGMGQAIARLLSERGFAVFGTSRDPSQAATIAGVQMLPLDVCQDQSATACVDAVLTRARRLDVLVNCAGYGLRGAAEETSLEEAKAVFETNLWGTVRMVKAVLPAMRHQRDGQIINFSSLAGISGAPFWAFYCASKAALESYTESLRYELKPFGIRVSIVQPGPVSTSFLRNRQLPASPIDDYAPYGGAADKEGERRDAEGDDPVLVAALVQRIIDSKAPRLRYLFGKATTQVYWMHRILPAALYEQVTLRIARMYKGS